MPLPLTPTSFGPTQFVPSVPQAAAGYTGTGATKALDGPGGTVTADFLLVLYPTATTTDENVVRGFKKPAGGALVPVGVYKVEKSIANQLKPDWQRPVVIQVRLVGTEEFWLSQEKNDGLAGQALRSNY